MKKQFYFACILAISMYSCKKELLMSSQESPLKLKSVNLMAKLSETDSLFTGNPPDPAYQMVFTDVFTNNNIDNNGNGWWTSRVGPTPIRYGFIGYNRASNLSVTNGRLSISFVKDPDGKYYGGGIVSNKTFGYGYYEAKFKLYTGTSGLHQSFWSFAPSIEIDGSETDSKFSSGSNLHPGRHRWLPTHQNYKATPAEANKFINVANTTTGSNPPGDDGVWTDADGVWYTVGYEWRPDSVRYFVNHVHVVSYGLADKSTPQHDVNVFQPAKVLLTALPYKGEVSGTVDPPQPGANMLISFFSYYVKPLPNVNLLGNNKFSYVTNDTTAVTEGTSTSWSEKPLTNSATTYGNTTADTVNSHVVKEGTNWYLEQKNTTQPYKAETYQTLNYVLPGTYTFSSDIRCSGGGSKFIVLDKDKTTVLYSRTILGQHSDWIHISDNIPVTNNEVTVLIYSDVAQGAWLQVDNVNFSLNP